MTEKRKADQTETNPAKTRKCEGEACCAASPEDLEKFEKLQQVAKKLAAVRQGLEREVLKLNHAKAEEFHNLYAERQECIKGIPDFWKKVISAACAEVAGSLDGDEILIAEYLESLQIEESLDELGAYRVTLIFSEAASAIFTPTTLVKEVSFKVNEEDGELVPYATKTTAVTFADPAKHPRAVHEVSMKALLSQSTGGEGDIELGSPDCPCVFEWFQNEACHDEDFGQVMRNVVWADPVAYMDHVESSDDESDFDGDEEDQEGAEENEGASESTTTPTA